MKNAKKNKDKIGIVNTYCWGASPFPCKHSICDKNSSYQNTFFENAGIYKDIFILFQTSVINLRNTFS